MKSLRTRIVVLGALMALASALICAWAAVAVAQRNIVTMEDRNANEAMASLQRRLQELVDGLAFEANDYGNWNDLYAQMPSPDVAWARINLTPGKVRGAVTQFFITAAQGRITGRFHDGDVRGSSTSPADPAAADMLLPLLGHVTPRSGLAVFAGHPAFYAVTPVHRSERQGEASGDLIALAYVNDAMSQRLESDGWSLRCEPQHGGGSAAIGAPLTLTAVMIQRDPHRLIATTTIPTHDGLVRVTMSSNRAASQRISDETALAIVLTGLMVAVGATVLGTWLGWRWLAPITALAAACRDHGHQPHVPLPTNSGLLEADVLSENLRQLILRLRVGQDELAQALDRETTTNAIHRRFLTHLGHEFGEPIRRIIALCEKLDRQSGHLTPEEVANTKLLAKELEQRFQEILGLVGPVSEETSSYRPLVMDQYLNGLAELMRPQVEHARMTIHVEAPAEDVLIDPGLLSPVLINLCANAIKAGRGGNVWLKGQIDRTRPATIWTVKDDGPGLPKSLADRIRDTFVRGEVLPGTPGFGMGLTLALANVHTLGGTMTLANPAEPGVIIVIRLPSIRGDLEGTASERIRRRTTIPL